MKEYLDRLNASIESGDVQEIKEAAAQAMMPFMAESYLAEFASLKRYMVEFRPVLEEFIDIDAIEALDDGFGANEWPLQEGKTAEQVAGVIMGNLFVISDVVKVHYLAAHHNDFARQEGKAVDSNIIFTIPPIGYIRHMLECDYLTVFDCIFLAGYVNDELGIIHDSIDIASHAIATGVISPRDPDNFLKADQLPKERMDGKIKLPDLSWLLTFEEAEQWLIGSFGLSLKRLKKNVSEKVQENPADSLTKPKKETDKELNQTSDEMNEREKIKLLRIIGLLTKAFLLKGTKTESTW